MAPRLSAFADRRRPSISTRDGVQHGFLRLPYSRDDSAWGSVMIPIASSSNGNGPTALLTGGNHGDEYEGPLALFDLARTLEPEAVSGTRHHRAGDELSGLPRRHAHLADRQGQHQPQLSRAGRTAR